MVGQREFMDVHDAWVRGKSISEIARQTGRERKTIRRLARTTYVRSNWPPPLRPASWEIKRKATRNAG